MISNINFTGLKNIGGMYNIEINADPRNLDTYLKPVERKYLLMKLTNDENGNDLDKYTMALAQGTPDLDNFEFLHDKTYLNVFCEKFYHSARKPKIFLNLTELPVKRNTIPIFEFLAKLTKKVARMKDSEFIYDDNFLMKDSADLYIMGDTRVSEICKNQREYMDRILDIYSQNASRYNAQSINDAIQERMIDYLI